MDDPTIEDTEDQNDRGARSGMRKFLVHLMMLDPHRGCFDAPESEVFDCPCAMNHMPSSPVNHTGHNQKSIEIIIRPT